MTDPAAITDGAEPADDLHVQALEERVRRLESRTAAPAVNGGAIHADESCPGGPVVHADPLQQAGRRAALGPILINGGICHELPLARTKSASRRMFQPSSSCIVAEPESEVEKKGLPAH